MSRKCPRTLDTPLLLFGLEVEDVALLALGTGIGSLLFDPLIPGLLGMGGWIALVRLKRDKPAGYVLHWLYSHGLSLPGLIPPPSKHKVYSPYGSSKV